MSKVVVVFSGVNASIASYTIGMVDPSGVSSVIGSIPVGGNSLEFTTPSVAGSYTFSCQPVDILGNAVGAVVTTSVSVVENVPVSISVTL